MVPGTIIVLILVTVSFILLWGIFSEFRVYADNYVQGGSCQASAALASFRLEGPGVLCKDLISSPVSMSCERRHVVIDAKNAFVVQGGEEEVLPVFSSEQDRFFQRYEDLNSEVVQSVFAEEMRLCWKQFGEGSGPLLDDADVNRWSPTEEIKTGCFICSEISFAEKPRLDPTDLQYYLRTNKTPGGAETYVDYFNSDDTLCEADFPGECWSKLEKHFTEDKPSVTTGTRLSFLNIGNKESRIDPLTVIDPHKQHVVVYVRKGYQVCQKMVQPENAELSNWVYAIPASDIPLLCDDVVT